MHLGVYETFSLTASCRLHGVNEDFTRDRGVGFELTNRFLAKGYAVYGTYRPETRDDCSVRLLKEAGAKTLELDYEDEGSVNAAARDFGAGPLDVLVNSADNSTGGNVSYRISKTAINQLTKTMAVDLAKMGSKVVTLAVHPGYLATKMNDYYGQDDMEECISAIVKTIESFGTMEGKGILNGGYVDWKGDTLDY
ncbi:Nn.00g053630.m01.CDS01 [Neocucurbitaria sp. VM-36]